MIEIRIARTAQEKSEIAAFRYAIYVDELGRYRDDADHVGRCLADPEDAWSWIAYARADGEIIATTRLTWGGDGFTDRQVSQYGLAPFLDELPPELIAVGERHMIAPGWRGSDLFLQVGAALQELSDSHGVRAVFGACEPHLLSYYCRFQRPYGTRNINSAEAGYLIPLVAFLPGPEALIDAGRNRGMPACVQAVLDGEATVRSPLLTDPERYWRDVHDALASVDTPLFEGFDEDELRLCVAGSNVISCAEGDRVIKKRGSARNVYVVLGGALEVNDDEHPLAVLLPGDVFGETAYLLNQPRTQNVDVLDDGTTILSLSEHTLRQLTVDRPGVAAKLLENVSKLLCRRVNAVGWSSSSTATNWSG